LRDLKIILWSCSTIPFTTELGCNYGGGVKFSQKYFSFPKLFKLASNSGAGTFFEQGGRGAENIKYKFRFTKKWPIICIN